MNVFGRRLALATILLLGIWLAPEAGALTTKRVSLNWAGHQLYGASYYSSLSFSGSYVAYGGVPNVYLVENPNEDRRCGCLPLLTPSHREEITVKVSEHVPCRADLDEDSFWPKRWEFSGTG